VSDPGRSGPFKTIADAIMPPRRRCLRSLLIVGTLTLAGSSVAPEIARATLSSAVRIVLQKGRHYAPTDLYLRQGDTITLRNGDDSLTHHAFIEAERFSFDAGDQEPGTETRLTLVEPGDFVIQCGIHPKMKLTIHVQ
jgi:plastocyanin